MLGQIRILTLEEGNTLTTIPNRWLISCWIADDRYLHKNNTTQCIALGHFYIIDKIKISCNNPDPSFDNTFKTLLWAEKKCYMIYIDLFIYTRCKCRQECGHTQMFCLSTGKLSENVTCRQRIILVLFLNTFDTAVSWWI